MPPLPIRRALISLSDKANLESLARFLHERAVTIVSTGGTAKAIEALGIPVTPVETVTGFPEILEGRVKTLHPKIHAALLAHPNHPDHAAALREHAITPIDLLVVNLYPFERTIAAMRRGERRGPEDAIENIDVGGPAMIRAAAKNHDRVAVLTDPAQYDAIIAELRDSDTALSPETRRRLAAEAFARTAAYDGAITNFLASRPEFTPTQSPSFTPEDTTSEPRTSVRPESQPTEHPLPPRIALPLKKIHDLRYGENPHQAAAVYTRADALDTTPTLATTPPIHGKPLSYNNLLDADAALTLARDLVSLPTTDHSAVVVKHTNPCGAALATTAERAVDAALAGDPLAAYGGILATSATVDAPAAERLTREGTYIEVLVARAFDNDALSTLTARSKNLRLIALPSETRKEVQEHAPRLDVRCMNGGFLIQSPDETCTRSDAWTLRAGAPADDATLSAALVVWAVCRALSSNAIAIGGPDPGDDPSTTAVRLFGAGAGQMDRLAACRIAVEKAGDRARGAIAASDAFFPFPDGPQLLIDAGVRTIIHPGGSKRDDETFSLCRAHDVTCYTTGRRHFRH